MIGTSIVSSDNIAGALIEKVPSTPTVAPIRNSATTSSSIKVDYTALTGYSTGGAPILSYSLEWDAGSNGVSYTSIVGESPNSLLTTFT